MFIEELQLDQLNKVALGDSFSVHFTAVMTIFLSSLLCPSLNFVFRAALFYFLKK